MLRFYHFSCEIEHTADLARLQFLLVSAERKSSTMEFILVVQLTNKHKLCVKIGNCNKFEADFNVHIIFILIIIVNM